MEEELNTTQSNQEEQAAQTDGMSAFEKQINSEIEDLSFIKAAETFARASMERVKDCPKKRGLFFMAVEKGEENTATITCTVGSGELLADGLANAFQKDNNKPSYNLIKFVIETIEGKSIKDILVNKLLQRIENMR